MLNDKSDPKYFIRDKGLSAFDGAAFHYTVYRNLLRFLGLDGVYSADGDPADVSWIDFWETIISTNDMINANDGITFDPRHMYGVTNQDVFRWPTIQNGTEKQLLGYFVVALLLPGIPTLVWGEEQVCQNLRCSVLSARSPPQDTLPYLDLHNDPVKHAGNSKHLLTLVFLPGVLHIRQYRLQLRFWKVTHELCTGMGHAWMLQCCDR